MATFTICVPTGTVFSVEGSPSTVTVTVHGDVASVVITTTPPPPFPSTPWERAVDPELESDPWLGGR